MKLGIVADAHFTPDGTGAPASQSEHEVRDPVKLYSLALRRCVKKGVDGLVLLGDLSRLGDDGSLETGVGMAAETGLPVWAVSGNHDCGERVDALEEAIDRVGAFNVRLLAPAGVAAGEGLRMAGVSVTSGDYGYTASPVGGPDASAWRNDECVVWLTHYPMISFTEDVWEAASSTATTSKISTRSLARSSRGRRRPS